jgi:hypothetical protein
MAWLDQLVLFRQIGPGEQRARPRGGRRRNCDRTPQMKPGRSTQRVKLARVISVAWLDTLVAHLSRSSRTLYRTAH